MERTSPRLSEAADLIAELGRKYIWWRTVYGDLHPPERIVAQVMNLGTYDDIRRLELAVGPDPLVEIMAAAQPGWFSPRSWEFWRGRLARETGRTIADKPPRRVFLDDPAL